jgi:hypothetical protein
MDQHQVLAFQESFVGGDYALSVAAAGGGDTTPPSASPVTVQPTAGIVGSTFKASYTCPTAPAVAIERRDGQPTSGVDLGLPVSGDGRTYSLNVTVHAAGVFIVAVTCNAAVTRSAPFTVSPAPTSCKSAALIGVRGSGDQPGTSAPGRHAQAIAQLLQRQWHISLYDRDGGNDGVIGLSYPSVSVTDYHAAQYFTSVNAGVQNLLALITQIRSECGADYPVLLTGFSQGSHVIQSVLDQLAQQAAAGNTTWQSIVGVGLMASPRFSPQDPDARGTFAEQVTGHGASGAALIPARFGAMTRTYCATTDPVCNIGNRTTVRKTTHTTAYYDARNPTGNPMIADVAGLLAQDFLSRAGQVARTQPTGRVAAFEGPGAGPDVVVSAAAVYGRGAPSTTFDWDTNGDGKVDQSSAAPTVTFINSRPGRRTVTVTVNFGDGSQLHQCIALTGSGSRRC